jgi:hypothetical protein
MVERFGILLVDEFELILRVYETENAEWKLIYYFSKNFTGIPPATLNDALSATMATLFSDAYTQHIAEWKLCARSAPNNITKEIERLIGLSVETVTRQREQELLCKGMFTELW